MACAVRIPTSPGRLTTWSRVCETHRVSGKVRFTHPTFTRSVAAAFVGIRAFTHNKTVDRHNVSRVQNEFRCVKRYATATKRDATCVERYDTRTKGYARRIERYATRIKHDDTRTKSYATRIKRDDTRTKRYATRIKRYATRMKCYASGTKRDANIAVGYAAGDNCDAECQSAKGRSGRIESASVRGPAP